MKKQQDQANNQTSIQMLTSGGGKSSLKDQNPESMLPISMVNCASSGGVGLQASGYSLTSRELNGRGSRTNNGG